MDPVAKTNAFLGKFVGPNAAHMIDAGIGVGIAGALSFVFSAPARGFLVHHALLGALVSLGVPVATALASKFRKAAGSDAPLVDQLVGAVTQAVKDAHATVPADPPASPVQ